MTRRDTFPSSIRPSRLAIESPAWPARVVLAAAAITAGTFLVLPWLERFSRPAASRRLLTGVEPARLPPPPPPLPLPEPPEPQAAAARPPVPRLAEAKPPPVPLSAALRLSLPGSGPADVNVDVGALLSRMGSPLEVGASKLVFEIGDVDAPPQPLVQMLPMYPPRARMLGLEGAVVLEFVVTAEGRPTSVKVVSFHPGDVFVGAAVEAVQRWRFKPGAREGRPVPVRVIQKITFKMEGSG
jgi:protein TonB